VTLAKTRQSHLIDFLYDNQNTDGTFGLIHQDTAYAIEIIDYFNAYFVEVLFEAAKSVDVTEFKELLINKIQTMFNVEIIDLYELLYYLDALNRMELLEKSLGSSLHNNIYRYLNETNQIGGGFGHTNTSTTADMVSTFFVYNIYALIEESVVNQSVHKTWVLSCNNTDGGYGGNQSLSSTIVTTYFAVYLVDALGAVNDLVNKTKTLEYFESFYVDDPDNIGNFGGYLPDFYAENTLLSSTFYCVQGIELIDESELNGVSTVNWVLNHQNFRDGGYGDWVEGNDQRGSSISASFYAFKLLELFDSLEVLDEDIFAVEFSYLILIIIPLVIGVIIGIIYLFIRRRRI
jgi:prenyltransferase beta subunit